MSTTPANSRHLHNFSLPPYSKWRGIPAHTPVHRRRRSVLSSEPPLPPSIAADHGELTTDVNASDSRKLRCQSSRDREVLGREVNNEVEEMKVGVDESEEKWKKRPWNLRPRRGLLNSPMSSSIDKNEELKDTVNANPEVNDVQRCKNQNQSNPKSVRRVGLEKEKKKERRLWIALSKEEIEDDIISMTGSRPSRKPSKRPKNMQKEIDQILPGLWLEGLTGDTYQIS